MLVTLVGIVILLKIHPLKAATPMLVTLLGMLTLARL